MATAATISSVENRGGFISWFWEFLKGELTPYPGRGIMVARIVLAATITMILTMTFRIPGGALGAIIAFLISRENFAATTKFTVSIATVVLMATIFVPVGGTMFASVPITHFFWECFSIFLIFFLLRSLANFAVATILGVIGTSAVALWYLPGPAEYNVEQTLWQVLSPAIGAAVTLVVEAVFHAFQKQDQITIGLDARLKAVEDLLTCYSIGTPIPKETAARLTQFATIGIGTIRRFLARSRYTQLYRAQMDAVISLVGRSQDFAAAMAQAQPYVSPADSQLAAKLAKEIAEVRQFLKTGQQPPMLETTGTPSNASLLRELEGMVALLPRVIQGSASLEAFQALSHEPEQPESGFLLPDAFINPDHLRFALGGCLAGTLCYVVCDGLAWRGPLATSLLTCVLTALSTIGASRQKQVLRVAGTVIGGFIFGLGAQIFILPNIDSITAFTLLFVAVSTVAAWVGTASSRLSYCGLQIAVSFYFIHLNDFTFQTSLTIGRDRTVGVLLGIAMMWLAFERLQPTTATDEMLRIFTRNLRSLAELAVYTLRPHDADSIVGVRRLRNKIFSNFAAVNSQADAVPFELGALRMKHMAARDRVRLWQAQLRTAYVLQLALLQYRVFGATERLSAQAEALLRDFDQSCSQTLNDMAAYLEAERTGGVTALLSIRIPTLPPALTSAADANDLLPANLLPLAHELMKILKRVREQILATPLFAIQ
ncbi:FUSC family protein [Alloacidobacterium dinghuense]|uniref:FUSC family protein n=1 Tax=Alloacidobacterium dinghuense TaxID=2763107 RepID=A0A7G8BCV8_9BACT|nr:FUSC family protein [Alloacidobacterium dinghuense]QNI30378.1 FUSC family protein [Alloacidobacterium dinghuense]